MAAGVGVGTVEQSVGILRENLGPVGTDDLHVGQTKLLCNLALIAERFGKKHLGI